MHLKITSGAFKGRLITAPKGNQTRPTSEKIRQSFFNSIQFDLEDALFLDIFAGSGAVGIEALSRGANHVCFIEQHKLAIEAIRKNIFSLKIQNQATLFPLEAIKALPKVKKQFHSFNMIYIDPPYHLKKIKYQVLELIEKLNLLEENGFLFIEEDKHNDSQIITRNSTSIIYQTTKEIGEKRLHVFTRK